MQVKSLKQEVGYSEYAVGFLPEELSAFSIWLRDLPDNKVGVKMNGQMYRFGSLQERACFVYGLEFKDQRAISKKPFSLVAWWKKLWRSLSTNSGAKNVGGSVSLKPRSWNIHAFRSPATAAKIELEVKSNSPIDVYAFPSPEKQRFVNQQAFYDYDKAYKTYHAKLSFTPLLGDEWLLATENRSDHQVKYEIDATELCQ